MSLPSERERGLLDEIAHELREAFDERGHRVGVALDADPAFGSGHSRSALRRDLAKDVIANAANRLGLHCRPVGGGGLELVGEHHRYRLRRALRDASEALVVEVSSESSLGAEEEPGLFPAEHWVFAWIYDVNDLIAEVVIAKILGIEPGSPGRLCLGSVVALGVSGPLSGGFMPTDEGLDFGDEEDMGGSADGIGS
ncbi:hypothetical protein [Actinokineospora sp. NBRC 105648]|uniref:hypothetical protein n=1 Tax=Actinokineospora sp. NBRC 105648 TaxID=3032206 RepID=UPI0024A1E5A2|nr:hypothetical protein [Actinokineospora sp. NBRC 105648]GLZ42245.1 hypothetical protein Acsp05_58690 [Actinokineospora sp. NBRC 105648]